MLDAGEMKALIRRAWYARASRRQIAAYEARARPAG
jgi:hypothetical protein